MKQLLYFLLLALLSACNQKQSFIVEDFDPIINYDATNDTLFLKMDLTNSIIDGITIPSADSNQIPAYFRFAFRIKNNSGKARIFYYKIYYQNESYKFSEVLIRKGKMVYNPPASNNFYGSWENCQDEFHNMGFIRSDNEFHLVVDSFRIVGNPREERKYFGAETSQRYISSETIEAVIARIRKSDEWMQEIKRKAEQNKISVDEQLYSDASWVAEHESKKGDINNRWKRNPRVGNYSFLLVVVSKRGLRKIPSNVRSIDLINEKKQAYLNPYYYYLYDSDGNKAGIWHQKSDKVLNTKATIDIGRGIYVDSRLSTDSVLNERYFDKFCNNSEYLFRYAQFEQYFHHINKEYGLKNIPVILDVVNDGYSLDDYHINQERFNENDLISDYIRITENPGKTVGYDSIMNALVIKNPGNKDNTHPVKENVGLKTRTGFTYGKFRAKIKFPEVLNDYNVWNGITCSLWLLYQEDADWNNRSICVDQGYIPKDEVGETDIRTNATWYSEIDLAIVKASKFWPMTSYKNVTEYTADNPVSNKNLIIACTNWDLACREPSRFIVGAENIKYHDDVFVLHRWDDWYQALSLKSENHYDETVGDVLYYEIDWQPDKIIWRIGKSRDKMKMIGYMDNTVTKIPDNQMITVISQEFQYADWWPTTPFKQDYIPYPKNDVIGYIYEIEIE